MKKYTWVPQEQVESQIDQAKKWLSRSGVIAPSGAATAWLAPEDPSLEFISSEITGYAIGYLCWQQDLPAAQRSAHWLTSNAIDPRNGSIRCRFYKELLNPSAPNASFQHSSPIRWTFDAGIVLHGLLALYRDKKKSNLGRSKKTNAPQTADAAFSNAEASKRLRRKRTPPPQGTYFSAPALAESIQQIVEHLLYIRQPNGFFAPRWNIDTNQPAPDLTRWSAQSTAYHAKIDRSILIASQLLNQPTWIMDLPQRIDRYIEQFQTPAGAFLSYPNTGGIHTHPHLYACEGLWVLGKLMDNQHWITTAKQGIHWLTKVAQNGSIPRTIFNGTPNYHGRGDTQAQYLRGLILFEHPDSLVQPAYHKLCKYQNTAGAFIFGHNADGTKNPHADTWGTIAAIQALSWLRENKAPDPRTLI